jgi:hypothetical protein
MDPVQDGVSLLGAWVDMALHGLDTRVNAVDFSFLERKREFCRALLLQQ